MEQITAMRAAEQAKEVVLNTVSLLLLAGAMALAVWVL